MWARGTPTFSLACGAPSAAGSLLILQDPATLVLTSQCCRGALGHGFPAAASVHPTPLNSFLVPAQLPTLGWEVTVASGLEPALMLLAEDRRRPPAGAAPVLLSPGAPHCCGPCPPHPCMLPWGPAWGEDSACGPPGPGGNTELFVSGLMSLLPNPMELPTRQVQEAWGVGTRAGGQCCALWEMSLAPCQHSLMPSPGGPGGEVSSLRSSLGSQPAPPQLLPQSAQAPPRRECQVSGGFL